MQGPDHTVSRTYSINAQGFPQTETLETENGIAYSVDPNGVIYVMNGTSGGQTRSPLDGLYDNSLYAYALPANAAPWTEFF